MELKLKLETVVVLISCIYLMANTFVIFVFVLSIFNNGIPSSDAFHFLFNFQSNRFFIRKLILVFFFSFFGYFLDKIKIFKVKENKSENDIFHFVVLFLRSIQFLWYLNTNTHTNLMS